MKRSPGLQSTNYRNQGEHAHPSGAPEFTPVFICMFCRSLFVLLYVFFWSFCCLFFFDIQILITPLVSSNSSLNLLFLYIGVLISIFNVFSYFLMIHGCINRLVYILCLFICLMVFNGTFNNISFILWQSVLLMEETGGPEENHRPVESH